MFLRSLKLNNYRKFRDELIEFPEGMIGIIGPNGSGKSSILEAIGWALYGNELARSHKIEVKSQNAEEEDDCEVELIFDFEGHSYKISRVLKGKNAISNALVYLDGSAEPIAQRDSGVNQYIEDLLGMDYVTFLRTVYAKQKELAALSTLNPEQRKKVIRRMLNIDRIDLAVVKIRADVREQQQFIKGVQINLEDLEELEQAQGKILEEQKTINKHISGFTAVLEKIKGEKEEIKKEKDDQEQKYKAYNVLDNSKSRFETQQVSRERELKEAIKDRDYLQQKKENLDKIEPSEQEYLKVKKEKEGQETLRLQYQEKIAIEKSLKSKKDEIGEREEKLKISLKQFNEFSGVQGELDNTEKHIDEKEIIRRKLEKQVKEVEKKAGIYSSQIEELLSKKKKITQLGKSGECPTCFRKLGDNCEDIIDHLDREISEIKKKLSPIQEESSKLNNDAETIIADQDKLVKKKSKLYEILKKKSKVEQSVEEQSDEIKKLKVKIGKDEDKLSEMKDVKFNQDYYLKLLEKFESLSKTRDTILELRKETQRIPRIVEKINVTNKELESLETQVKKVKEELNKLDFDEKQHKKAQDSYEDVNDRLIKEQKELDEEKSKQAVIKEKLVSFKNKIVQQKENRKKIEATQIELQYLQRLESLLDIFRLELTGRIRPLLETRASYLFNEITDGRYPSIELDEDYEMSILDGNKSFQLKRFSGGEEDLANLCLRVAMSQVIAERSGGMEINFIALDEIFGSQDEDRRQNILNSLNKLSSQFRQIFLISHIEDIKEMLAKVLHVEENVVTKESKVLFG